MLIAVLNEVTERDDSHFTGDCHLELYNICPTAQSTI